MKGAVRQYAVLDQRQPAVMFKRATWETAVFDMGITGRQSKRRMFTMDRIRAGGMPRG